MIRRRSAVLSAVFLTILCLQSATAETIERPQISLAIGTFNIGFLPLPIAQSLDFFHAEGLDVTVQTLNASGAKALQALIGGSTDVVLGAYDHTVQMQAQGKDIRCAILLNRSPGAVLAVRKDLSDRIRTIRDLKGAKIGITGPGSSSDYMLRKVAVDAGLALDDVNIVAVGSAQSAVAAVENGSVDAVFHLEPAITTLERKGLVRILLDTRKPEGMRKAFGSDYPWSCVYSTKEFIDWNPVTTQRLVNAFAHALDWINSHSAAEITDTVPAEYVLGGREEFQAIVEGAKGMFPPSGHFNPADLERVRDLIASFDEKVRTAPFRIENTFTNRFVDAVPATRPAAAAEKR